MNDTNPGWARLTIALAGIVGASGVMAAAGASHGDEARNLGAIATVCLAHGPALLALGLAARGRLFTTAALLLALGTLIFAGDLAARMAFGHGVFPLAAPLGGVGMIGGWTMVVVAAIVRRAPLARHDNGRL